MAAMIATGYSTPRCKFVCQDIEQGRGIRYAPSESGSAYTACEAGDRILVSEPELGKKRGKHAS